MKTLSTYEQRQARLKRSCQFLREVILPRVCSGQELSGQEVDALYTSFCQQNAGPGDDFELTHSAYQSFLGWLTYRKAEQALDRGEQYQLKRG